MLKQKISSIYCASNRKQIRVFSRGHLSLKQEKEKSFCGGRSRKTKKVLGREEMWHGLAMKDWSGRGEWKGLTYKNNAI